ncbi:CPBP family intramembrane metalloprotease [Corallococcus exiguus]|uniref:CPBP family intramembrane glutamic endopeptidase n=1 Tax=Corallococcus TaxID=83461 RepID=UPI000EA37C4E|nr:MULTISPECIES: CPBP family intramembrane glutamic endopeptidase [Corallococcus]NNC19708.1 CPBP family intramembrane metalloprotease [Corallococcus exiguus]RKH28413.1 CPBP family intramembrane metalloprotease [Corallococcus sp. CA041A]RUO88516.1 CPBP family intramembrane metalloprotease [Corallococcus sp. AB018]
MDSPSDPSSTAHSPVPTSPPRVWTVLVAFALLVTAIVVGGVISASIAMAMEMLRAGVKPQDTVAIQALTEQLKSMPWLMVAAVMTSSCFGLVAALLGGFLSPTPLKQRLRLDAGATTPAWAWVAALVGCFTMGQAMESLSVLAGVWNYAASLKGLQAASQGSFVTFAALLFFGALVAGTGEELFFRGYVQTRLVERWGRTAGIAGAATLFGILHFDPIHSPMALMMGLFLGWLAERTGSVRLPIFVHAFNNLTSFLLSRYAPSTTELPASVHVTLLAVCSLAFVGTVTALRRMDARPPEPVLVGP